MWAQTLRSEGSSTRTHRSQTKQKLTVVGKGLQRKTQVEENSTVTRRKQRSLNRSRDKSPSVCWAKATGQADSQPGINGVALKSSSQSTIAAYINRFRNGPPSSPEKRRKHKGTNAEKPEFWWVDDLSVKKGKDGVESSLNDDIEKEAQLIILSPEKGRQRHVSFVEEEDEDIDKVIEETLRKIKLREPGYDGIKEEPFCSPFTDESHDNSLRNSLDEESRILNQRADAILAKYSMSGMRTASTDSSSSAFSSEYPSDPKMLSSYDRILSKIESNRSRNERLSNLSNASSSLSLDSISSSNSDSDSETSLDGLLLIKNHETIVSEKENFSERDDLWKYLDIQRTTIIAELKALEARESELIEKILLNS